MRVSIYIFATVTLVATIYLFYLLEVQERIFEQERTTVRSINQQNAKGKTQNIDFREWRKKTGKGQGYQRWLETQRNLNKNKTTQPLIQSK